MNYLRNSHVSCHNILKLQFSQCFNFASVFSTTVQIRRANVKGIFFLECLGWLEERGRHLYVLVGIYIYIYVHIYIYIYIYIYISIRLVYSLQCQPYREHQSHKFIKNSPQTFKMPRFSRLVLLFLVVHCCCKAPHQRYLNNSWIRRIKLNYHILK